MFKIFRGKHKKVLKQLRLEARVLTRTDVEKSSGVAGVYGHLDGVDGLVATGWAFVRNEDGTVSVPWVEILCGDEVIASVRPYNLRSDISAQAKEKLHCGFVVDLVLHLREHFGETDGLSTIPNRNLAISARIAASGAVLAPGSVSAGAARLVAEEARKAGLLEPLVRPGTTAEGAIRITAGFSEGRQEEFAGCVDQVGQGVIAGWVVRRSLDRTPIALEILMEDTVCGMTHTGQARPDVSRHLGFPVEPGFRFDLGRLDNLPALAASSAKEIGFAVRVAGTTHYLDTANMFLKVTELKEIADEKADHWSKDVKRHTEYLRSMLDEVRPAPASGDVRVIAFYLPQFHPIPENDAWWGAGLTEWTQITKSVPVFEGHYQPHLPADLGYYDLRVPEVREAQARLASEYGVSGFCYYYYWFDGRRILERPFEEMLSSGKPDFPFCICWANENWSRRWDGSEHELLLGQEHTLDSDIAFIYDVLPVLRDPRYILVGGAPILVVYRASLLQDSRKTIQRWREICRENGIERIHVCAAQTFGLEDPRPLGFDSAVQFPPHGTKSGGINHELLDLAEDFKGNVFDYREVVRDQLGLKTPPYKLFRTAMLGWDNTARRPKSGNIFHHCTPSEYEIWLRGIVDATRRVHTPEERVVFVNAWNEWAEGTHLEPDVRFGRAFLQATRRAVSGKSTWDQLIEEVRRRGSLNGDALDEFLDRVEGIMRGYENEVAFLLRRHTAREQHWGVSHFSSAAPDAVLACPLLRDAKGRLDYLNQHDRWDGAVFRSSDTLLFHGWAFAPGAHLNANSKAFLVLQSRESTDRYYAPIFSRFQREDVAKAFPDMPPSVTQYSGFFWSGSLHAVPPGTFTPGIIIPGQSENHVVRFDGKFTVIG